ncbi:carboxylesterase [Rhyzopertha dominica]|nr:carboxylesterase [Rhyzopertha dominica]
MDRMKRTTTVTFSTLALLILVENSHSLLSFIDDRSSDPKLQVYTSNGLIQGKRLLTERKHVEYFSFQGIPYAQPPIKDLRFRAPRPAANWTGVLRATEERDACLQNTDRIEQLFSIGSEDCLYLNVYTPNLPKSSRRHSLLPVMVWIYGGAFVVGESDSATYGPDYLLENGMVVVTFNYRLGMFGFLSTGDMNSPGNYGLKDQVAALRWVQTNIRQFGGNPGLVTIFGQSAGAASVQYHMLSPMSVGLFHRAIAESGSVLCPWALQRDPAAVAFQTAISAGIFTANTRDLVNRLREIDYSQLRYTQLGTTVFNFINTLNGLPFSPCLEPEHEGAFITKKSYQLLQQGRFIRVPYMTGINSQESVMFLQVVDLARPFLAQWDIIPQVLVPDDMNIATIPQRGEAGVKIKDFYFDRRLATLSTRRQLLDYITDSQFLRPIRESAVLSSRYVPVYFYLFSYEGRLGVNGNDQQERRAEGVAHAEEMWYIWRKSNLSATSPVDEIVRDRTLKMWTNFARTGNPTPVADPLLDDVLWPPVEHNSNKTLNYLEINSNLTPRRNPKAEAMVFWDNLYEEYGNPPYDTY